AFLPTFASAALCIWALYVIGRELGQSKPIATVSALAAASLQVFVLQSVTVYSDLFVALLLLVVTALLLRWRAAGCRETMLVGAMGLALGVAVGTKYSAIPASLILAVVIVWQIWRYAETTDRYGLARTDARWALRQMLVLAAAASLCSLYWYARNTIEHGNPV